MLKNSHHQTPNMDPVGVEDYEKIFEKSGMGKDILLKERINEYLADMLKMHHEWGIPIPEELFLSDKKKHRLHAPEILEKK